MVIKIKLFWGGNGSSPLLRKKNITITEILYKRRGQAQLDIVNRLFEIHSTVFERVHSSLFSFSFFFSFNVRFFFYGCGRCCHFSRSFLPELSLLLLDVCFEKKKPDLCI